MAMQRRGFLNHLRGHIADVLGIRSPEAAAGEWWEIDLIIVVLAGAFAAGIIAWS